jgi:hypothetical protein
MLTPTRTSQTKSAKRMNKTSDIRDEILCGADESFWRSWIENKERLAQFCDSELAKRFWDERP